MLKYGKTKQAYHRIVLDSFSELWWMASFSFFICCPLESVLQRGVGRQAGETCLFALSRLQLAGWGIFHRPAGSELCWAWGAFRCGVAGRGTTPGQPVAGWRLRDCWGEQGANSLVLRMLKRKTFHKDLEGTAKSLLRLKHPEEASGLRARLGRKGVPAGTQWDRGGLIYKSFQFSVF